MIEAQGIMRPNYCEGGRLPALLILKGLSLSLSVSVVRVCLECSLTFIIIDLVFHNSTKQNVKHFIDFAQV